MSELEKRKRVGEVVGKAGKLTRLAADLERKAGLLRHEIRVDMRISEVLAEAEINQDELERE